MRYCSFYLLLLTHGSVITVKNTLASVEVNGYIQKPNGTIAYCEVQGNQLVRCCFFGSEFQGEQPLICKTKTARYWRKRTLLKSGSNDNHLRMKRQAEQYNVTSQPLLTVSGTEEDKVNVTQEMNSTIRTCVSTENPPDSNKRYIIGAVVGAGVLVFFLLVIFFYLRHRMRPKPEPMPEVPIR